MKKILFILLCVAFLSGCETKIKTYENKMVDDLVIADISKYAGVPKTSSLVKQGDFKTANDLYEDGGAFVLYAGFSGCAWCRELLPVLLAKAEEYQTPIVYLDQILIDLQYGDDGSVYGSPEYIKFLETYKAYLITDEWNGMNVIQVPQLLFVKDKKVVYWHIGTVDDHDAHVSAMSDSQLNRLKKILDKAFKKLLAE